MLTCKGRILEVAKVEPEQFNFGQVPRKTPPPPQKLTIRRADAGPLKLALVDQPDLKSVKVELREIEPGAQYELEAVLSPPYASLNLRQVVKLTTGAEQVPNLEVPLYAMVAPRVAARPARLFMPRERRTAWQQEIQLVWDDNKPSKILAATVNDASLTVRLLDKDKGQNIVVEAPAGADPVANDCALTIQFEDEDARELRVPIGVDVRTTAVPRPPKPADAGRARPAAVAGKVEAQPAGGAEAGKQARLRPSAHRRSTTPAAAGSTTPQAPPPAQPDEQAKPQSEPTPAEQKKPADEKPTDEKPTDEKPTDEKPTSPPP
ncbi:MAG TPA: hypothetical protein PKK06_14125 [Phycisphaerae bacterium]|nr:hypothetical protein [Phycisphaerae bacterium]HNU46427.1 hypothetical protein [Phycisphaerae bacterium]